MADASALARRNRRTLFGAMGFVGVMVGISFAAVPLYDLFCRATGYAGTPMLGSAAPGAVANTTINIRFVASTSPGLPWHFAPQQVSMPLALAATCSAYDEDSELMEVELGVC